MSTAKRRRLLIGALALGAAGAVLVLGRTPPAPGPWPANPPVDSRWAAADAPPPGPRPAPGGEPLQAPAVAPSQPLPGTEAGTTSRPVAESAAPSVRPSRGPTPAAPGATTAAEAEWLDVELDEDGGASLVGGVRNFQESMRRSLPELRACAKAWTRPDGIGNVEIDFEIRLRASRGSYEVVEARPIHGNVSLPDLETCVAQRWRGLLIPAPGVADGALARVVFPFAMRRSPSAAE